MEAGIVIVQCSYCGAQCFGWDKQTGLDKFKVHRCLRSLSDEELHEILEAGIKRITLEQLSGTTPKIPKPQAPSLPPKMRAIVTIARRFVGPPDSG